MFAAIVRSLLFYRRVNIVVSVAVAITTAVIGGAMIVGDSVRYSLQEMTRQRLGQVTHVIHGRFVREQLATDLAAQIDKPVAPALLVTCSLERHQADRVRRAANVGLTALTDAGWDLLDTANLSCPANGEIVLGAHSASELQAAIGDQLTVWVELPSAIPRDSLLGEREQVVTELTLTVAGVLPEQAGASRWTLQPGQQLPGNAFVSLSTLQSRLDVAEVRRSKRTPIPRPALINTLLIHSSDIAAEGSLSWQQAIHQSLTIADLGLRFRSDIQHGYVSAETDRMILERPIAEAVELAAAQLGLRSAPTLVSLVNEISAVDADSSDRFSMYPIVAGVPLEAGAPLGPFGPAELAEDEIILSAWLQEDLQVQAGDRIAARWHEVGSHGDLPEIQQTFRVAHVLPEPDPISQDVGLTPHIPGVTDVESFSDWDQPFEMETDRITGRDDAYWAEYRATPKAFVSLAAAQKYWSSRFGQATSVRVASDTGVIPRDRLQAMQQQLTERVPRLCDLPALGLLPVPVLRNGLQAAVGANDFTQLFSGFSFFLMLAAVLLSALMFRLGIQQRIRQAGLLQAVGISERRATWFFAGEGLLVAGIGSLFGAGLAVGFARLMVFGLTTWWRGAIGTQFLLLQIQPFRLVIAIGVSLLLAWVVIVWSLKSVRRSTVRQLLSGQTAASHGQLAASRMLTTIMVLSWLCGLALPAAALANLLPGGEAFSGLTWPMVAFFLAGSGCLTGGLLLLRQRLQTQADEQRPRVTRTVTGLALANASRNAWRSLLTVALIASAVFLIVAVAAGHRNPLSEEPERNSGNGGFRLVAETSQPVLYDINTADGRVALNLEDAWQASSLTAAPTVYSFAMRPGEDASCVNLYQTRLPTLLGATDSFLQRGGFRFANTPGENPWQRLTQISSSPEGLPKYPVIGDMNTLMYSLKKGIGDVIPFPDAEHPVAELEIIGMLDGSLFQGVLVTSREALQQLDPAVSGFRYFLVDAATGSDADSVAELLETGLNAAGLDAEPVGQRIAGFLAVQNTYLSTFQLLGGLGLLVGIFGLAVVMIRNIVERQAEIALLRAVGFTGFRICRLVLAENSVLLLWGMLLGTGSALLAMLPHLLGGGGDLPWQSLSVTLGAVAITGLLAAVLAVRRALQVSVRDHLSVEA